MTKETLDQIIGEDESMRHEIEDADAESAPACYPMTCTALHIRSGSSGAPASRELDSYGSPASCLTVRQEESPSRYHRAGHGALGEGTLIRPQNFPRGSVVEEDREEALVDALLTGDPDDRAQPTP